MKRFRYLIWLVLVGAVGMIWWRQKDTWGRDFRLGVVDSQGLGVVSISSQRMMINSLRVRGETKLWVPKGLAWYGADKIEKLLMQEGKEDLADDILFYNFGFVADKVVYVDEFADWQTNKNLFDLMGINWFKFFYQRSEMMEVDQELSGSLADSEYLLDEIMVCDMADSDMLTEEIRLRIVNTTDFAGMAGFLAQRLSWLGLIVTGVENQEGGVNGCRLVYEPGSESSRSLAALRRLFDCEFVADQALARGEMEFYLGEEFGRMLNYDAYVRAF